VREDELRRQDDAFVRLSSVRVFARALSESELSDLDQRSANATLRVAAGPLESPGRDVTVCVRLENDGRDVAGVQSELAWDPYCATFVEGSCVARAPGKDIFYADLPGASSIRIFALSLSNIDPIADGDVYCCDFTAGEIAADMCCPVFIRNALGADAQGAQVSVQTSGGEICAAGHPPCA
jgi:hypothetical protein